MITDDNIKSLKIPISRSTLYSCPKVSIYNIFTKKIKWDTQLGNKYSTPQSGTQLRPKQEPNLEIY